MEESAENGKESHFAHVNGIYWPGIKQKGKIKCSILRPCVLSSQKSGV
jgi:hypothetical protein